MYKEVIKPSLILFIVCAVVTGALAYVNGITQPIIEENERIARQEAMAEVLPGSSSFSEPISYEELKEEGFPVSSTIRNIYEAVDAGYVVEAAVKGYGGEVNMMIGIDLDKNIKGIKITSHNETPGLGAKVADEEFLQQHYGQIPEDGFKVIKGVSKSDSEIEAVSGATISTMAVTQGASDAAKLVSAIIDGVKEEQKDPKQAVLPGAVDFTEPVPAEMLMSEGYDVTERIVNLYTAEGIGYVVEVISEGYGGPLTMMVGFDTEKNITGVKVVEHTETSGLGSQVTDTEFLEQFKGVIPEGNMFKVVTRPSNERNEIEAVSSATVSSLAVTRGVTDAIALINSLAGGN
ncbi:MAG: RnfABCDGE type electron transport complex subunit G [Clostridiaceae bacterium]|nr:RnfABCDGE type electron transport complex subunit G [Clostridiaceae bacterium]